MASQTIVIGLGQFGMSLARALAQNGSEVLAVDTNLDHIEAIAPIVSDAVQMDAMDAEALANLAPEKRDVCICAIGDENREASIIVTALLRQLGAPRIIARATDELHARILSLVGAHEVVNPERSYGEGLAVRLAWRNVVNVLPLGDNLVLTELQVPELFVGRTLLDLDIPRRYQVTVCAVRRKVKGKMEASIPDPRAPLQTGDVLMLVSEPKAVRRLTAKV